MPENPENPENGVPRHEAENVPESIPENVPDNPDDAPEDIPEGEENSAPGKKRRFGWKSVLLALAVFAVVGSLVQSVLRGGDFGGALNTTGDQNRPEQNEPREIQRPKKPKTVDLGNKRIPRASGPIIVINPGLVAPGGKATIEGSGFDAKSSVDVMLRTGKSDSKGQGIKTVKADRTGSINTQFTLPEKASGKSATIVAQQRNADNVAEAELVSGSGIGSVKVNKAVGRPGDSLSLSARGFGPGERIDVHWGRVSGTPLTTLTADPSGGVGRASVKVGVAPTGDSTLVLVGRKTKTTATAPFEMLGLYPSVKSSPYALKSGKRLSLSAKGFAPGERVLVYINTAGGVPAFTANADANGNVGDVAFDVPFGLKGEQNLTVIGDKTRAVVRSGFQVLPYTPTAEPSAFGGKAGTTLSFYVSGFAPNEKVTVYAGGTDGGGGKKVSTFQVDAKGEAEAAGSYELTEADANGVSFRLVGDKTDSTAEASVNSSQDGGGGGGNPGGGGE